MGDLFADVASEPGCTHEISRKFGETMQQAVRGYVAETEASGGGTGGTA
jgi:hypothetical protein